MSKAAELPYGILEAVTRHLSDASEETRPALIHLALRLALHPELRPFLTDPRRTLAGQFLSLDAQLGGLMEYALNRGFGSWLDRAIPDTDKGILRDVTGISLGDSTPFPPGRAMSGTLGGALYIPSLGSAAWCRIVAVALPLYPPTSRWPAPVAVRPVSNEVAASAHAALRAALAVLEGFGLFPEDLVPTPIYYDICPPELADDTLATSAGDSLGLPLTLAFLSSLYRLPIMAEMGATGAVGRDGHAPGIVHEVGHVFEKAQALRQAGYTRFLAPRPLSAEGELLAASEVVPEWVSQASEAAVHALPESALGRRRTPVTENVATEKTAFLCARVVAGTGLPLELVHRIIKVQDGLPDLTPGVWSAQIVTRDAAEPIWGRFPNFLAAAKAALTLQRAFLCHLWESASEAGAAGIGVAATEEEAARLAEAANASQTLLTDEALREIGPLPPDWTTHALREWRLRDLHAPLSLVSLTASGLSRFTTEPLPRALDPTRHNLPIALGPCIGREEEIAQIRRLLVSSVGRVVTLTGGAGVGKTRLGLESVVRCYDHFADGIWFVPLHEAKTADDVAIAIADAMHLPLPAEDPGLALIKALGKRHVLLMLDNGEGTTPTGTAFITELLRSVVGTVCLVTSRMRLRIPGETEIAVGPLRVAPESANVDEMRMAPAVQLFLNRSDLTVAPDDTALALVSSLSRRLGGLPLALEIAAAQTRYLPLEEVERRLAESVVVSRGGGATTHSRILQQTLEWSYALLEPDEKVVLRQISVFPGGNGFTMPAALAVIGEEDAYAYDHLLSLEEKALLQRRPARDQERYFLLPLVRDLAVRHQDTSEVAAARAAHAAYFREMICDRVKSIDTETETHALDELDTEMDQVRAAFNYFVQQDMTAVPSFVRCAGEFLRRRGRQREWVTWPRDALRLLEEAKTTAEPVDWSRLHHHRADAHRAAGRLEDARQHVREAISWGRRNTNREALADALNMAGLIEKQAGQLNEAERFFIEAREVYRTIPSIRGEITAVMNLATMAHSKKEYEVSRTFLEEGITFCRKIDDQYGLMLAMTNLGVLAFEQNDLVGARRAFEEAVTLALRLRATRTLPTVLMNLGESMARVGEWENGMEILVQAEQIFLKMEHHYANAAAAVIAEFADAYGKERLETLQSNIGRRSLDMLLRTDPRPARNLPIPLQLNEFDEESSDKSGE